MYNIIHCKIKHKFHKDVFKSAVIFTPVFSCNNSVAYLLHVLSGLLILRPRLVLPKQHPISKFTAEQRTRTGTSKWVPSISIIASAARHLVQHSNL